MCREGTRTCGADGTWGACEGEVLPAVERCDAADDENCDGLECIVWAAAYGQTGDVHPMGIASDAEGNVFVSAAFFGTITIGDETFASADTTDVLLMKLSPAGDVLWARQFGDRSADNPWGLAVDSKGNPVVAGQTTSGAIDFGGGPLPRGAFIVRLDSSGEHIWSKGLGGGYDASIHAVAIDARDNVIVAGSFAQPIDLGGGPIQPDEGEDIIVAKLDGATGLVTAPGCWAKKFGGTGAQGPNAVAVDRSRNIFVAGWTSGAIDLGGVFDVENNSFVVKLTPSGAPAWVRRLGEPLSVQTAGIAVDASGRPVVAGHYSRELRIEPYTLTASDGLDTFVVQLEADGDVGWVSAFRGDGSQSVSGVALDPDDNIVVAGQAENQIDFGDGPLMVNDTPGLVAKLTPDAKLAWHRLLGSRVALDAVATSPDGATLVAGWTKAVDADFGTGPLPGTGDGILQRLVIAKLGR
ncbi:SBBP repeat-containing protein [Sorangium sp. So ce124]|uniref:SBBP repeat-containing protein n=1 Tax=Sorangium sp. So ce124 TaxID=3133280 RepID=UPI003F643909